MSLLVLTGLLFAAPGPCDVLTASAAPLAPQVARVDRLELLYARGKSFTEFLAGAKSRRKTWIANYANATIPVELLQRARQVAGRWRLLVVAEDWCGDSANTIPYLARLSDSVASLELRIVNARDGRWVLESHRTSDDRAATPTVILLDASGAEAGCFVERPAALREWLDANRPRLSEAKLREGREAWRRKDAGRSTLREMVELLEAGALGKPRCGR